MLRIKQFVHRVIRNAGYELRKPESGIIEIPYYLSPSAHKLYDFRQEAGFAETAGVVIDEGRTLLHYNRLLILWQAVKNTFPLRQAVAEVGSYRGGSARFLALAFAHFGAHPPIHIFDTFSGHPNQVHADKDGPHAVGLFSDTSLADVSAYLAGSPNIVIHDGRFEERCETVADQRFALVHIDVDIFASTVSCLEFFWPRLLPNGVIVIDDYGFTTCRGLKEAVDQFIAGEDSCRGWYMHTGQFVVEKVSV